MMKYSLNKKKLFVFVILMLITALCTSCSSAPVTKKEMDKYVTRTYGKGNFLKEEKSAEAITYFYEDKEYGFEYWVKSFSSGFTMDNATFFKYENKDSDFEEQYYAYITEQLEPEITELEQNYGVKIEKADIRTGGYTVRDFGLANLILPEDKRKQAHELSGMVARLYQKMDARNFWKEGYIKVYTAENELIGYYDVGKAGYLTEAEKDVERFEILARQKDRSSEYQYIQTVSIEEFFKLTGLSLDDVQEKDQEEVVMCFFETKNGKEFFIADVIYRGDLYSNY